MKKLVYIGENTKHAEQLRRILAGEYSFEAIERSKAFDLDDCALVIIEKRSDPGSHKRNMVRFESLLGFRDIPIVVSLDQADPDLSQSPDNLSRHLLLVAPFGAGQVRKQIQRALSPVGEEPPPDEDTLQVIAKATRLVIGQIVGVEIAHTGTYPSKNYHLSGDSCGLMPLTGYLEGCIAVGLSTLLSRRLSARLAGCDEEFISDEDLPDGVGEIINQISGKVKTILSEQGRTVDIDLPKAGQGANASIAQDSSLPVIVLLFECNREPFALYVCLRQNADSFAEQRETCTST